MIEKLLSDKLKEENELSYTKKDPFINKKKLKYEDSENNLTNPFENINDVLEYSKKSRENSWKRIKLI